MSNTFFEFIVVFAAFSGAVLMAIGYKLYFDKAGTKEIIPSTGMFYMWVFAAIAEAWSYFKMTNGDIPISIIPVVCMTCCICYFLKTLIRKGFDPFDKEDYFLFATDIAITFAWLMWIDAALANILYQGTIVLSFRPVVRDLMNGTKREHWLPWTVWTASYVLHLGVAVVRMKNWEDVSYPIVCIVCHGGVAVLARPRKASPLQAR